MPEVKDEARVFVEHFIEVMISDLSHFEEVIDSLGQKHGYCFTDDGVSVTFQDDWYAGQEPEYSMFEPDHLLVSAFWPVFGAIDGPGFDCIVSYRDFCDWVDTYLETNGYLAYPLSAKRVEQKMIELRDSLGVSQKEPVLQKGKHLVWPFGSSQKMVVIGRYKNSWDSKRPIQKHDIQSFEKLASLFRRGFENGLLRPVIMVALRINERKRRHISN